MVPEKIQKFNIVKWTFVDILFFKKLATLAFTLIVLKDLIETSLNKDLNVNIHHQWASLFALHMNLESQFLTYINASSYNFDFNNE